MDTDGHGLAACLPNSGLAIGHSSSVVKPACLKCRSPVRASVKPSSRITVKDMQSVSDQALSGRPQRSVQEDGSHALARLGVR